MEQAGSALWDRYPVFNSKLTVVFVPQVGFLVALPQRIVFGDIGQPAIDLPADFTHVFNQDEETFFKNVDMLELDQRIGDLDGLIKDTEGMIVTDLEESILDSEAELRETFKALSELDCLLSFASCAVDFKYTRPSMIEKEQNTVYIKEGRHPLQEIISEGTFVSNFTKIDDNARLNIITGPNFSGKSCYMRQVGTMVFMAHIGSFIPCTKAVISITDQISARISSIESCAVPQSSFQLDLTEMAAILRKSTKHSLVLIDEFGKGTSPASGIAVLVAALETLAGLGSKVVCTTHFLEIFSLEILGQITSVVKPFRMAMRLPKSTCEEACPLFRLEDGVSASSAGLVCAEKAGLDPSILQRAEEIIAAIKNGLSIKPITAREQPSRIACSRNQRKMLRLLFGVESWEEAEAATVRDLIVSIARM
jgi:DNA mismatch repair protein MSH5